MTNPTGLPVRGQDRYGSGAFAASRTSGTRHRLHGGIDFLAEAGQPIIAPIGGVISRYARPYGDGHLGDCGLVIETPERDALMVKLFYVQPALPPGDAVEEGQVVGVATSLQRRYPGISDHVHVEVWQAGRRVDPVSFFTDLRIGSVERA